MSDLQGVRESFDRDPQNVPKTQAIAILANPTCKVGDINDCAVVQHLRAVYVVRSVILLPGLLMSVRLCSH